MDLLHDADAQEITPLIIGINNISSIKITNEIQDYSSNDYQNLPCCTVGGIEFEKNQLIFSEILTDAAKLLSENNIKYVTTFTLNVMDD